MLMTRMRGGVFLTEQAGYQFGQRDSLSKPLRQRRSRLLKIFGRLSEAFGPQHWWPADGAFEVVVGAILTQNAAWTNVEKAIENLRSAGCLTPEALHRINAKELARLLRPCGYFNIKAKRLKSFVHFLWKDYRGDIKTLLKEEPARLRRKLLGIKGVGPETADSILLYGGGFPWFVVDAYTRRIFSRHGFVAEDIHYEPLQEFFMETLPRDPRLFNEYHALIVKLGKDFCRKEPVCDRCPVYSLLGEPVSN